MIRLIFLFFNSSYYRCFPICIDTVHPYGTRFAPDLSTIEKRRHPKLFQASKPHTRANWKSPDWTTMSLLNIALLQVW